MINLDTIIMSVGLVAIYYVLVRRLAFYIQPLRLKAVDVGDAVFDNPQSEDIHNSLAVSVMDTLYSPWTIVGYMLFAPYVAIRVLFSSCARNKLRAQIDKTPHDLREHVVVLCDIHQKSAMAANPLLALLWMVERLVIVLCMIIMGLTIHSMDLVLQGVLENNESVHAKMHHRA